MQMNTVQNALNSARLLLEEGRTEEALLVIQTLQTEEQQKNRDYLLGWYDVLRKKWQEAAQQLLPLLAPLRIATIEPEDVLERERSAFYFLRLGQVAVLLAHFEDASHHFLSCMKIMHDRRIQRASLRIEAQYSLAMTYKMRGSYALAIRNYEQALRLCRHHQFFDPVADIYYGLSETYRSQGDFVQAYDAARKALQIYQEKHNEPLQTRMYNILGKISFLMGDYGASEKYYDTSLLLAERNEQPKMIMLDCAALAELFLEQEQMTKAKENATRALEIADKEDAADLRGVVFTTLGKIALAEASALTNSTRQSKFNEAISWWKQAAIEFQKTQSPLNLVEVYSRLATLVEDLGNTKDALEYWKRAYEEKEKAKSVSYVTV